MKRIRDTFEFTKKKFSLSLISLNQPPAACGEKIFMTKYFTFQLRFLLQYFPTTVTIWIVYIVVVFVVMTALKLINLSLHKMYDKARTLSETSLKKMSTGNASGGSGMASSNKIQREASA